MKIKLSNILIGLFFLAGLSLLLYPTVSDYVNSVNQSRVISNYTKQIETLDNSKYEEMWAEADAYNESLKDKPERFKMTDEEREVYNSIMSLSTNGVMATIEIPSIDIKFPVYHGTSEAVLQVGIGHVEGTSLPVGGEGTHCALSGHRGLPSAKLFTDLDKVQVGDQFMIHVLNETLTYEVDQILIVEPHEMESLKLEEGKDYCTLITCTPYGINTHRILVRGARVNNE